MAGDGQKPKRYRPGYWAHRFGKNDDVIFQSETTSDQYGARCPMAALLRRTDPASLDEILRLLEVMSAARSRKFSLEAESAPLAPGVNKMTPQASKQWMHFMKQPWTYCAGRIRIGAVRSGRLS